MKRICKIVTCGDVDSGKSTLLGRLLYNTGNIYEDQLIDIEKASKKYSLDNRFEYGLLFDGLLEERKQQITIDIAHRFFNLQDTRFHLFDCPGHSQYTHNFVIAAAEADIAVLVIDSTKGLMPQTFIHLDICKLFKIQHVILAVTKVDLADNNMLNSLEKDIREKIMGMDYKIFKTSAIENINMDDFAQYLYETSLSVKEDEEHFALCVQAVKKKENKRFYQVISFGKFAEHLTVYPSKIACNLKKVQDAVDVFTMAENIDISRGFIITDLKLHSKKFINGRFVRFNNDFNPSNLIFKYGTAIYKVKSITQNSIEFFEEIDFCNIDEFKRLGYGLVIDNKTKLNAGVFVISDNKNAETKNYCYWFTGYSGSGKTTLAKKLVENFAIKPILLDGDDIRKTINYNLTLSDTDRDENVKKIANLANLFIEQGFNVVVACISKDIRQRMYAKNLLKESYVEIFVEASDETRKQRDTKGLYKNNIKPLANYEFSCWDYITINTDNSDVDKSFVELLQKLSL